MKNTQTKSRANLRAVYVHDTQTKEWRYAIMTGTFPVFYASEKDATTAAKAIEGYDINKHIVGYAPDNAVGVIDGQPCENWNQGKYSEWLADETRDVEIDGKRYRVTLERDEAAGRPWEECEGHGSVSEWLTRDKRPGELVVDTDRHSKRFYDYTEAVATAKAESWGIGPTAYLEFKEKYARNPTKNEVAAIAARQDYEHLMAWCDDEWSYQCLTVERYCECCDSVSTADAYHLGAIEGVTESYLESLISEAVREIESIRESKKGEN